MVGTGNEQQYEQKTGLSYHLHVHVYHQDFADVLSKLFS